MLTEKDSIEYQAEEWVEGRPWHNTVRDECCPDFSCCRPDLLWPKRQRELFVAVDSETQYSMLMIGLQTAIETYSGKEVHVVDPAAHDGVIH